MGNELENQLQRIEKSVADLKESVRTLLDDRSARPAGAANINQRLRRFLEKKK